MANSFVQAVWGNASRLRWAETGPPGACRAMLTIPAMPGEELPCIRAAGHDPLPHAVLTPRHLLRTDWPADEAGGRQWLLAWASPPDRAFDARYLAGVFADAFMPVGPLPRRNRFRHLVTLFRETSGPGLVAECGCWLGLSSYLLCHAQQDVEPEFRGEGYHIYDSFLGLSTPTQEDDEPTASSGAFAAPLAVVQRRLADFPAITYHQGWIPETWPVEDGVYRFVHVDVDLYQPTLACLRYFWPRLRVGGRLVCDDYGGVVGARRAVDEFCGTGMPMFVTPEGQAVLTKEAT